MDKDKLNNSNIFITGLDLLNINQIKEFFIVNSKILYNFNFVSYLFSLDNSSKNLNILSENKKLFIKKHLNLFGTEKNNQIILKTNKIVRLFEINNFTKLTKENFIFEFSFLNNETLPVFDKISLYVKEFKDIFEIKIEEEKKEDVKFVVLN